MIHHGDCLIVLRSFDAESIDACVTDPPYGIGFMGKEWDNFRRSRNPNDVGRESVMGRLSRSAPASGAESNMLAFQAWTEQWAREVLRVLKPGGHALVCGAPRSYHRMASGLEDAGFEIRDCLAWLYGSGFPKSLNLGEGLGTALKPAHEPIVLARKPFKGSVTANVEQFGTGALNIDATRIAFSENEPYDIEERCRPNSRLDGYSDSDIGPNGGQVNVSPLGRWPANVVIDEVAAAVIDEQSGELTPGSDKTRNTFGAFAGTGPRMGAGHKGAVGGASRFYKTCAHDCILCDTSTDERDTMSACETTSASTAERRFRTIRQTLDSIAPSNAHASLVEQLARRVPCAESLCARCATRIALALVETKLSDSRSAVSRAFPASTPNFKSSILTQNLASFAELWASIDTIPTTASLSLLCGSVCRAIENSTRSASLASDSDQPRFLYSAKPSRKERDMGCYGLQARSGGEATNRVDGSAGLNNPRAGAGRTGGGRNFHPTVKPVELMRWLVRLVTPLDGVVLDPFMGSGTTGMAARYEQRGFIGIEREADYIEIAERRIDAVAPLFGDDRTEAIQ